MRHTPGKWTVDFNDVDEERGSVAISTPEWGAFARVVITVDDEPSEEGKANAYLIAAAPEMLAALEAAQDVISQSYSDLKIQIANAIAKARGKEENNV